MYIYTLIYNNNVYVNGSVRAHAPRKLTESKCLNPIPNLNEDRSTLSVCRNVAHGLQLSSITYLNICRGSQVMRNQAIV